MTPQAYKPLNSTLGPSKIESLDTQRRRALVQVRSKSTLLEKYIFMSQLRTSNPDIFYALVMDRLEEFAPIIYTPTVGTACLEFSNIYPFLHTGIPDGLYLDSTQDLEQSIRNYKPDLEPQIAVITDGSRILGLGDLGLNGMGISLGKLQLYVAGAGIDPRRTLPIVLDLGTNNQKLVQDEFYLGLRQSRPSDEQFYNTVDTVLEALYKVYPQLLVQFEDWSSEHAFGLLEKYQDKHLCFNDDIQGTGAVILSGIINAVRRVQNETGMDSREHCFVFYGAGSAAIGVARQIQYYFQTELGMSEEESRNMFWIVDSKGLVTLDRGDKLVQHKVYYARRDNQGKQYKDLLDIIEHVKPTALIGLSSTPGAFDRQALTRLGQLNALPIVFPLSNPATQAECTFSEALEATENRVIFASGTAFPTYTDQVTGKTHVPDQGNNMYIFPGLGLGSILAQPTRISNEMIYAASKALADSLKPEETAQHSLYPSLVRIRQVSCQVAVAVIKESIRQGLCQNETLKHGSHQDLLNFVADQMWYPIQ